jgi:hypothetical protein
MPLKRRSSSKRLHGATSQKAASSQSIPSYCSLKSILTLFSHVCLRIPVQAKGFSSSLCVQTSFVANPVSCPMGTGKGPSPKVKRGLRVMLTTHPPSSADVKSE